MKLKPSAMVNLATVATICILAAYPSAVKAASVTDWTPPKTTVSKELIEVGQFLLKHGLGDPRGGKFGLATVKIDTNYSRDILGWMKQAKGKQTILGLDGLVTPITSDFKEVNIVGAVQQACDLAKNGTPYNGQYSQTIAVYSGANTELAYGRFLSDQATILLLIYGNTELAERLFAFRKHYVYGNGVSSQEPGLEPTAKYNLLRSFLQSLWLQAVNAHLQGEDELAHTSSKVLAQNREAYEAYALTLKTGSSFMPDEKTKKVVVFKFLEPVSALYQDSKRRLKEGKKKVDLASLDGLEPKDRVKKLIDWLDEASARQMSQPGGVYLSDDRIVKALIKEGNAAGDALLDCMEKDTRLTRSASFHRDFFPDRDIKTVKAAAFAAFCGITQIDAYGINMRRQPTVAELREKWLLYKNLTPAERWYDLLADDKSSHQQWVAVANWMATPNDIKISVGWVSIPKREEGKPLPPLNYVTLPEPKKSALPELLRSRAKQIEIENMEPSTLRLHEHDMALQITLAAFAIDGSGSIGYLQDLVRSVSSEKGYKEYTAETFGSSIARAYSCLIRSQVPDAGKDYGAWIKKTQPNTFIQPTLFAPLLLLPEQEANAIITDFLLSSESEFNIDSWVGRSGPHNVTYLIKSPLVGFSAFRQLYTGLLKKQDLMGTISSNNNNQWEVKYLRWSMPLGKMSAEEQEMAKIAVCRSCDLYAFALSNIQGAPAFRIYWPISQKNEAIVKLSAFLDANYKVIIEKERQYGRW